MKPQTKNEISVSLIYMEKGGVFIPTESPRRERCRLHELSVSGKGVTGRWGKEKV